MARTRKRKLTLNGGETQTQKLRKQQQDRQKQLIVQQAASKEQVKPEEGMEEEGEEAEFENFGEEQDVQEVEDDEDLVEEVEEEVEVEVEEELEVEEEVEVEEEEEEDESVKNSNADDDTEPIQKLLEPFSKEQLIKIISDAAENHRELAARVRKIADEEPVHRKIFVHGLGWDTTTETLRSAFDQYGGIEDCKAVTDKASGKSKGYGFILFKSRSGAYKALKEPQKKIGNRMTACQLAAVGPVPAAAAGSSGQPPVVSQPASDNTKRKIYVSNVAAELDPQKLYSFFAKFGEIEEGPLGLDKKTGKPKGFCLFVYKTVESARKALEEPHKNFEGHVLNCQKAFDSSQKHGKQNQNQNHNQNQQRNPHHGTNDNSQSYGGGGQMMAPAIPFNPGFNQGAAAAAFNPALEQALTALLATGGFGIQNLLGSLGAAGAGQGIQGGYGNQAVGSSINPGVVGGFGAQPGLQSAYPNQQKQGGSRTQQGHIGGVPPYTGQ